MSDNSSHRGGNRELLGGAARIPKWGTKGKLRIDRICDCIVWRGITGERLRWRNLDYGQVRKGLEVFYPSHMGMSTEVPWFVSRTKRSKTLRNNDICNGTA